MRISERLRSRHRRTVGQLKVRTQPDRCTAVGHPTVVVKKLELADSVSGCCAGQCLDPRLAGPDSRNRLVGRQRLRTRKIHFQGEIRIKGGWIPNDRAGGRELDRRGPARGGYRSTAYVDCALQQKAPIRDTRIVGDRQIPRAHRQSHAKSATCRGARRGARGTCYC